MLDKKYLYIGIPVSVISGVFLILDAFYQEIPDSLVAVVMIVAVMGLVLCYKGGAFNS
ncbi:hypothetical protein [Maribacter sp.]|uniref:hypothetical protein n=1 Tax=Maribacter sp. TaxID=1897614 RepID=UPI0025C0AFDF|nr:hypothetical protein [Maribacter sp.]|tara:strand:+ start:6540 stop:6713 length:174 start_codon:yes stop_codon:yes gene_type:complete